jgi:hypothetical protein
VATYGHTPPTATSVLRAWGGGRPHRIQENAGLSSVTADRSCPSRSSSRCRRCRITSAGWPRATTHGPPERRRLRCRDRHTARPPSASAASATPVLQVIQRLALSLRRRLGKVGSVGKMPPGRLNYRHSVPANMIGASTAEVALTTVELDPGRSSLCGMAQQLAATPLRERLVRPQSRTPLLGTVSGAFWGAVGRLTDVDFLLSITSDRAAGLMQALAVDWVPWVFSLGCLVWYGATVSQRKTRASKPNPWVLSTVVAIPAFGLGRDNDSGAGKPSTHHSGLAEVGEPLCRRHRHSPPGPIQRRLSDPLGVRAGGFGERFHERCSNANQPSIHHHRPSRVDDDGSHTRAPEGIRAVHDGFPRCTAPHWSRSVAYNSVARCRK